MSLKIFDDQAAKLLPVAIKNFNVNNSIPAQALTTDIYFSQATYFLDCSIIQLLVLLGKMGIKNNSHTLC